MKSQNLFFVFLPQGREQEHYSFGGVLYCRNQKEALEIATEVGGKMCVSQICLN